LVKGTELQFELGTVKVVKVVVYYQQLTKSIAISKMALTTAQKISSLVKESS
jgi:hypothetical protein